jgi:hypothetical protein
MYAINTRETCRRVPSRQRTRNDVLVGLGIALLLDIPKIILIAPFTREEQT